MERRQKQAKALFAEADEGWANKTFLTAEDQLGSLFS